MADGPPCKTSSTHEAATAAVDNQLGSSTGSNASAAAANQQQQQQQLRYVGAAYMASLAYLQWWTMVVCLGLLVSSMRYSNCSSDAGTTLLHTPAAVIAATATATATAGKAVLPCPSMFVTQWHLTCWCSAVCPEVNLPNMLHALLSVLWWTQGLITHSNLWVETFRLLISLKAPPNVRNAWDVCDTAGHEVIDVLICRQCVKLY